MDADDFDDFDHFMQRRQLVPKTSPTLTPTATRSKAAHCTQFTLPSGGHLNINPTSTITLSSNVVFTPECKASATGSAVVAFSDVGISGITDLKDPFHASTTPQVYATAAATVLAWMLVIMLLITPRTYFVGGAGGGFGILNRHGMIGGSTGGASVIGVGSRPWLQKVAALTVAVSLTIATADTFEVAERQYLSGFMNAEKLRAEVVGSTEIKVTRVVSDIFLWLAQVQTLIRLFPRHREKVLIKWIGFALIILDATFSCLNNFVGNPVGRPKRFRDAIPALSYLFQLALSMLYAAWVIYYSVCKRRWAFYHKDMWNVTLVAFLSFVAILTPVVFFITDISNQSVAGWGDYFRWVGAAAASVIVWEWVERIEALEREEKKDGILGREVFDGEEMLDTPGSDEIIWLKKRRFWGGTGGGDGQAAAATGHQLESDLPTHQIHYRSAERAIAFARARAAKTTGHLYKDEDTLKPIPMPPPVAVSPVSRADTASAASTVYTVRYHTLMTPTPPVARNSNLASLNQAMQDGQQGKEVLDEKLVIEEHEVPQGTETARESSASRTRVARTGFHLGNPFKRRRALPPEAVRAGQVIDPVSIPTSQPKHDYEVWDVKGRLGALAADQGEKFRERKRRGSQKEKDLPVTIIPAQPRGRTWSPDATLDLPGPSGTVETLTLSGPTAVESPRTAHGPFSVSPLQPGAFDANPRPRTSQTESALRTVASDAQLRRELSLNAVVPDRTQSQPQPPSQPHR